MQLPTIRADNELVSAVVFIHNNMHVQCTHRQELKIESLDLTRPRLREREVELFFRAATGPFFFFYSYHGYGIT